MPRKGRTVVVCVHVIVKYQPTTRADLDRHARQGQSIIRDHHQTDRHDAPTYGPRSHIAGTASKDITANAHMPCTNPTIVALLHRHGTRRAHIEREPAADRQVERAA